MSKQKLQEINLPQVTQLITETSVQIALTLNLSLLSKFYVVLVVLNRFSKEYPKWSQNLWYAQLLFTLEIAEWATDISQTKLLLKPREKALKGMQELWWITRTCPSKCHLISDTWKCWSNINQILEFFLGSLKTRYYYYYFFFFENQILWNTGTVYISNFKTTL